MGLATAALLLTTVHLQTYQSRRAKATIAPRAAGTAHAMVVIAGPGHRANVAAILDRH